MGLHLRTHAQPVEGCFGCKAMDLTISGVSPTVTRGQGRSDRSAEKAQEKELSLYRSARSQGIQPATTRTGDIRKAIDISNQAGAAYDASTNTFSAAGV